MNKKVSFILVDEEISQMYWFLENQESSIIKFSLSSNGRRVTIIY